ncbi:unnamed protein product [Sphenostylis stenocarpa]|uniref:Uncharacterized protein n=1 Tax=Sphenostylis stenocarpa TaxID=92480 RepID=A0AA86S0T2_9FABA|nr:unnamed protein product [Sphenostylis stenocarpa]
MHVIYPTLHGQKASMHKITNTTDASQHHALTSATCLLDISLYQRIEPLKQYLHMLSTQDRDSTTAFTATNTSPSSVR